jgi:hypothetical protein
MYEQDLPSLLGDSALVCADMTSPRFFLLAGSTR